MMDKINAIKQIYNKPHLFYGIVALSVGVIFAIVTPPFHGPDEDVHYFRAYQIARGNLILENKGDGQLGTCLPTEIYQTVVDSSLKPNIRGLTASKYNTSQLDDLLTDEVNNPENCKFTSTTNTHSYSPFSYLPAVLGVGAINLFNGPPLAAMYMARFATVLITTVMFALALYLLPGRKYPFLIILLTPMLIYQQAVISIDGFSYALLAIFIAFIIRLHSQNVVKRKHWIYLGLLVTALCFIKPLLIIFAPVALLLLSKDKVKVGVLVLLVTAIFITTSLMTASLYKGISNVAPDGVNQNQQIEGLKNNPLRAIRVAWNTYTNTYGDSQTRGLIGQFGYADTPLPLWMYTIGVVNVTLALIFSRKLDRIGVLSKQWALFIIFLMILYFTGVNAAMYLAYSPVGYDIFYGVQGRYFLPLLIILPVVCVGSVYLVDTEYRKVFRKLTISSCVLLLMSIVVVVQRYYLYTP